MAGVVFQGAWSFYTSTIEQRLSTTRSFVDQSLLVLEKFHALERQGEMTRAEAQGAAQAEISVLRYDGSEYVWLNDMRARMLMHPIKPALDGQDLMELEDTNGKRLFAEMIEVVERDGSGYVDYHWPKPGSEAPVPKRSYVTGFAPWDWVVGSGVYVDDARAAAIAFAPAQRAHRPAGQRHRVHRRALDRARPPAPAGECRAGAPFVRRGRP